LLRVHCATIAQVLVASSHHVSKATGTDPDELLRVWQRFTLVATGR
jgi:hypothetical protein